MEYKHRRPHRSLARQISLAYAGKSVDRQAGVLPAASRVEAPVGAASSLRLDTRTKLDPILSRSLVLKTGGDHQIALANMAEQGYESGSKTITNGKLVTAAR